MNKQVQVQGAGCRAMDGKINWNVWFVNVVCVCGVSAVADGGPGGAMCSVTSVCLRCVSGG